MKLTKRRDFLKITGLGLMSGLVPVYLKGNSPANSGRKLSVQLYTIREEISKDVTGSLKRLASIGFRYVETAFWPKGMSLPQAAGHLREAGLQVSSSHIEIPIGENRLKMLETAKAFGTKKMVWHGWPEDKRYSSLEGTRELIKIYNESSRFAKDNGLQFGLHNHWWEYRNRVGGKWVYEILNAELDPDIYFEVDTYWVKVAGQNPASIISKLGKRVRLLHIKDGPAVWRENLAADNPDPMTSVGKGTQDFPAIFKAAGANPEWMVVEMDKTATNVFEALQESYDYLVRNKFVNI